MSKCVRCGHCCRVDLCPYGAIDYSTGACLHLEVELDNGEVTLYRCAIHDEIKDHPSVHCMPGFGAGCMYKYNEERAHILLLRVAASWSHGSARPAAH